MFWKRINILSVGMVAAMGVTDVVHRFGLPTLQAMGVAFAFYCAAKRFDRHHLATVAGAVWMFRASFAWAEVSGAHPHADLSADEVAPGYKLALAIIILGAEALAHFGGSRPLIPRGAWLLGSGQRLRLVLGAGGRPRKLEIAATSNAEIAVTFRVGQWRRPLAIGYDPLRTWIEVPSGTAFLDIENKNGTPASLSLEVRKARLWG